MTPISEMTLSECLDEIRQGNYLDRHELADRIHSLTRWIPISERMPTQEDADERGNVLCRICNSNTLVRAENVPFFKITHWRIITTP